MDLLSKKLSHHFLDAFGDTNIEYLSKISPQGLDKSCVVSSNSRLAETLGIDHNYLDDPDTLEMFSGNFVPSSLKPIALVYSGHQFGVWAGQLGDGRAMTLGEIDVSGELWDIQLKGSGTTPYSRFADGRAVLRSSIREYLCSEAMNGLGIETTRALCLIDSSTPVYREGVERAAIVCRVARSHIRFGSFEHFHYRGEKDGVKKLADYVIQRHFPNSNIGPDGYRRLFENAVEQTAKTIAKWQSVGFAHGVMNTDNMSILGETIDYGPFGFIDSYDPKFICNSSDSHGRYAFENQPSIGLWNLNALANALVSLISVEELTAILKTYETTFRKKYYELMGAKLGITDVSEADSQFIDRLLLILEAEQIDYTNFFRSICEYRSREENAFLANLFKNRAGFDSWCSDYDDRLRQLNLPREERRSNMLAVNPKYVLRNYIAQEAINAAEQKDYSLVNNLLTTLQTPYDEHPKMRRFASNPPKWASAISVSCSS